MRRISFSHLVLLVIISAIAVFLNWSALKASTSLFNLIIIVPAGILALSFCLFILLSNKSEPSSDTKTLIGDIALLAIFAVFCISLTTVGFDVATFLFIWMAIILGGSRNWIIPPIYSAIFTLALVKGFGSLFPFPLPLMVF